MRHLNGGHWRYLHFCHWLHFKSKVQSPNSLLELEDKTHENLDDPHPSDNVHVPWSLDLKCISEKEEYVKEIKDEVGIEGLFSFYNITQIFDLFLEYKMFFFMNVEVNFRIYAYSLECILDNAIYDYR